MQEAGRGKRRRGVQRETRERAKLTGGKRRDEEQRHADRYRDRHRLQHRAAEHAAAHARVIPRERRRRQQREKATQQCNTPAEDVDGVGAPSPMTPAPTLHRRQQQCRARYAGLPGAAAPSERMNICMP